jgi:hypothetical protein
MYVRPESKRCHLQSTCPAADLATATVLEQYFSKLQSTFFCHAVNVKYEKQAITHAHALNNKNIKEKQNGP